MLLPGALVLSALMFAVVYYPTLNKLSRGLASPYAKADVGKRLSAFMVDGLIVLTMWLLYRNLQSPIFIAAGALYALMRDSIAGRSVGKFWFGLRVIDLRTGLPGRSRASAVRNAMFLVPGANVVAVLLEFTTIVRDPLGHRLGDRAAQTHVVEGLGARDLVAEFVRWWGDFIARLEGAGTRRRPRRAPVRYGGRVSTDPAARSSDRRMTRAPRESRTQRVPRRPAAR